MSASNRKGAVLLLGVVALLGGASEQARSNTLPVPSVYPTIQAGIDAAAFGDTVLVAPGTYTDYSTREVPPYGDLWTGCAIMKDGVVLKSESGPSVTTIDLSEITGFQTIGILLQLLPSDETRVEGFTVNGRDRSLGAFAFLCGNATFQDCKFENFQGGQAAGGAVIVNGDASFIDCEFVNCRASPGGAIYANSGHLDLIGCVVRQCRNVGVFFEEDEPFVSSATITGCQFIENTSVGGGGGLVVAETSGEVIISGCLFMRNTSTGSGAGALGLGTGPKTVENCTFIENGATTSTGGAIKGFAAPMIIRGCTFLGNYKNPTGSEGSAVRFQTGSVGTFEHNVVVGSQGGPAIADDSPVVSNCNVFWDNPLGVGIPLSATDRIVDPLFCDPEVFDLTLRIGSPCLPEDPLPCGLIGAFGQGCGSISVDAKSWGRIKSLYR